MDWKKEILTGPLADTVAPFVADGNDGGVVATLNAKTVDTIGNIDGESFRGWAAKTGIRADIEDIAQDKSNRILRSIALTLIDIMRGGRDKGIDFANPDNKEMLNLWLSEGKITSPQYDELMALATVKISRAEQVFGREVTIEDVARIRGK